MPSSSDCACRVVVPVFNLPTTRMPMPTPRFQNSGSLHCPIGTMTEARRHITSSLGTTPTMVYKRSLRVIVRPTICGSAPKRVRQKSDVSTTTGAPPFVSSSGASARPTIGLTPSTRKIVHDAIRPRSRSGEAWPVRLKLSERYAAIKSNERLRCCQSRKFG